MVAILIAIVVAILIAIAVAVLIAIVVVFFCCRRGHRCSRLGHA